MRLAAVRKVRRDQAVAVRLIGQVEEQLDIASIANAACHGEFRSRHPTTCDIRGATLYDPERLIGWARTAQRAVAARSKSEPKDETVLPSRISFSGEDPQ
ncbi:hypothetical protein ACU4GR_27490 [Methylobacterium oryzae CBMB20]